VVILGGGPAGAFTALELAQAGCDVVLLERQPASGWKIGETLPPESRVHLQRLGYWERFQSQAHLPCPGVVSVWGEPVRIEKDFIVNPYGHGWQLDRARFESDLLSAAAAAGCLVQFGATVERMEPSTSGWTVKTAMRTLRADWLVDCTGRRGAIVGRQGGTYQQLDNLVSVFGIAETSHRTDRDARTYVESHPEGWSYSALMPGGRRTVAFQTDRDLLPQRPATARWLWDRLAAGAEIYRLLTKHAYEFVEPPRVGAAHSGRFQHCVGPGWIAVGDAAMTFDPLSGKGLAKTLDSAHHAAQAILCQEDYQAVCDRMWNEFLDERRESYVTETRWIDTPFWSRRHLP
jgi:flavin-dependent dehydrogenase